MQISPAISVQSSSEIGVSGKKTGAYKKQKQQQTVVQLCFSKDDSQLISVDRKGSLTVTAKGSQVWAKPSLHQQPLKAAVFAGPNQLVTCSAEEAAVWSLKQDQPVVLLDQPTVDRTLQKTIAVKAGDSTLALCISTEQVAIYKLGKEGPKVRAADCKVSLREAGSQSGPLTDSILACYLD